MTRAAVTLLISVVILTLFGLIMIYDASSFVAFRDFGDKFHYIKEQSVWAILGFGVMIFFSYFDYRKLYGLALPILCVALILLIMVFIPGIGVGYLGAKRWIDLRFSLLQPAEFVKLALSIYLAAWFSNKEKGRTPAFLLLMGFILGLVLLEPDIGTNNNPKNVNPIPLIKINEYPN